ncbi:hypothetical protein [Lacticaseibacillus yichunensis]|uniref:SnoaL-like domain-containing protein n=1 Tax=Lacticaseibacillus yichunensis TaxID=2486015 RepID=A0ABW4CKY2_9LACO|nr:hypothetical protein [Lacticaseibacillus yichunensis]
MSDTEELMQLVTRERQYRVRHEDAKLAAQYWPDAAVETSWQRGGVQSFVAHAPAEMDTGLPIITRVCGPVVHQRSATRAYIEVPTISNYWEMCHGKEVVLTEYMRLLERAEKRDGIWKLAGMLSIYESDSLAPAIPGTTLAIDQESLKGLRHPYRFLAYTRLEAGGQISQDLLGIDQPEALAAAYQAAEDWAKAGA